MIAEQRQHVVNGLLETLTQDRWWDLNPDPLVVYSVMGVEGHSMLTSCAYHPTAFRL